MGGSYAQGGIHHSPCINPDLQLERLTLSMARNSSLRVSSCFLLEPHFSWRDFRESSEEMEEKNTVDDETDVRGVKSVCAGVGRALKKGAVNYGNEPSV